MSKIRQTLSNQDQTIHHVQCLSQEFDDDESIHDAIGDIDIGDTTSEEDEEEAGVDTAQSTNVQRIVNNPTNSQRQRVVALTTKNVESINVDKISSPSVKVTKIELAGVPSIKIETNKSVSALGSTLASIHLSPGDSISAHTNNNNNDKHNIKTNNNTDSSKKNSNTVDKNKNKNTAQDNDNDSENDNNEMERQNRSMNDFETSGKIQHQITHFKLNLDKNNNLSRKYFNDICGKSVLLHFFGITLVLWIIDQTINAYFIHSLILAIFVATFSMISGIMFVTKYNLFIVKYALTSFIVWYKVSHAIVGVIARLMYHEFWIHTEYTYYIDIDNNVAKNHIWYYIQGSLLMINFVIGMLCIAMIDGLPTDTIININLGNYIKEYNKYNNVKRIAMIGGLLIVSWFWIELYFNIYETKDDKKYRGDRSLEISLFGEIHRISWRSIALSSFFKIFVFFASQLSLSFRHPNKVNVIPLPVIVNHTNLQDTDLTGETDDDTNTNNNNGNENNSNNNNDDEYETDEMTQKNTHKNSLKPDSDDHDDIEVDIDIDDNKHKKTNKNSNNDRKQTEDETEKHLHKVNAKSSINRKLRQSMKLHAIPRVTLSHRNRTGGRGRIARTPKNNNDNSRTSRTVSRRGRDVVNQQLRLSAMLHVSNFDEFRKAKRMSGIHRPSTNLSRLGKIKFINSKRNSGTGTSANRSYLSNKLEIERSFDGNNSRNIGIGIGSRGRNGSTSAYSTNLNTLSPHNIPVNDTHLTSHGSRSKVIGLNKQRKVSDSDMSIVNLNYPQSVAGSFGTQNAVLASLAHNFSDIPESHAIDDGFDGNGNGNDNDNGNGNIVHLTSDIENDNDDGNDTDIERFGSESSVNMSKSIVHSGNLQARLNGTQRSEFPLNMSNMDSITVNNSIRKRPSDSIFHITDKNRKSVFGGLTSHNSHSNKKTSFDNDNKSENNNNDDNMLAENEEAFHIFSIDMPREFTILYVLLIQVFNFNHFQSLYYSSIVSSAGVIFSCALTSVIFVIAKIVLFAYMENVEIAVGVGISLDIITCLCWIIILFSLNYALFHFRRKSLLILWKIYNIITLMTAIYYLRIYYKEFGNRDDGHDDDNNNMNKNGEEHPTHFYLGGNSHKEEKIIDAILTIFYTVIAVLFVSLQQGYFVSKWMKLVATSVFLGFMIYFLVSHYLDDTYDVQVTFLDHKISMRTAIVSRSFDLCLWLSYSFYLIWRNPDELRLTSKIEISWM